MCLLTICLWCFNGVAKYQHRSGPDLKVEYPSILGTHKHPQVWWGLRAHVAKYPQVSGLGRQWICSRMRQQKELYWRQKHKTFWWWHKRKTLNSQICFFTIKRNSNRKHLCISWQIANSICNTDDSTAKQLVSKQSPGKGVRGLVARPWRVVVFQLRVG